MFYSLVYVSLRTFHFIWFHSISTRLQYYIVLFFLLETVVILFPKLLFQTSKTYFIYLVKSCALRHYLWFFFAFELNTVNHFIVFILVLRKPIFFLNKNCLSYSSQHQLSGSESLIKIVFHNGRQFWLDFD